MTTPAPAPVITMAALRSWTQTEIEDDDPFALCILMGVSIKLWEYGDPTWTAATLPPSVKLMGELKAKNFFEHPIGASREQVAVLSETYVDAVLQGLTFTESEIADLAEFSPGPGDGEINLGIWALTVTRGPIETHQDHARGATYYHDSWNAPFPLLAKDYFLGPQ